MRLTAIGCSFRDTKLALRERLAFNATKLAWALGELRVRYGCEAVILSTCNRVELYLARADAPVRGEPAFLPDAGLMAEFLSEVHPVPAREILPHLYEHCQVKAVLHLFRVAASLDSLVVGEGQIAGQVKQAYELADKRGSAGPVLHALLQRARVVAKRVRTATGIAQGHVSVSSVAVDYVREVFSHFDDKTILVIGAGKMGELTLKHLRELKPHKILVTNRSPEKAQAVALGCGGEAIGWEKLDEALVRADIVLSTTGAPEPIMNLERFQRIDSRRKKGLLVILDIAVPRDFDPRIHDGDRTLLYDIDDLDQVRKARLVDRLKHVPAAEAIAEQEAEKVLKQFARWRNGPIIARLTKEIEAKRQPIVQALLSRLNGKLTEAEKKEIEGAFLLFQSRVLHGPISALAEDAPEEGGGHSLLDALRKLFRLHD
jgi:glutamyl-tRNA reductase